MTTTRVSALLALCCASVLAADSPEKPASEKLTASAAPAIPKLDDLLSGIEVKPLSIPEKSTNAREFQRQMFEWVKRTTRTAIDRELGDSANAAGTIDRLLKWWCLREDTEDTAALLAAARKLAEPSAKLPLTQFFVGELCSAQKADDEADLRWSVCAEQSDFSKIPPWPAMLSAARIIYNSPPDEPQELRFFLNLQAAIKPEHCAEADAPFIVHFLLSQLAGFVSSRAKQLEVTFKEAQMPEWARLAILGEIYIDLARNARDGGSESSTKNNHAKLFTEVLGKAREALTKSWELRPDRPEAAARMITVLKGESPAKDEMVETWFKRAIAAEFDHPDAYRHMFNALMPRWGGTPAKVLALALSTAAAGRYDSALPEMFPMALQLLASESFSWETLFRHPGISRALVATRRGQIEAAKNDKLKAQYRGMLALEGWMTGDYATAAAAFDGMKKTPTDVPELADVARSLAKRYGFDWQLAFDESCVLASKSADVYKRVVNALESNRFGEAEALAKKIEIGPGSPELLVALPERVSFESGLGKAEWLPLPQGRTLWWNNTGKWDGSGELRAIGDDQEAIRLLRTQLGGRYEVRGKVRLPAKTGEAGFGFAIGHPTEFERAAWVEVYLGSEDGKATTYRVMGERDEFSDRKDGKSGPELSDDRVATFRIRRDNDKLSWWVNDKKLVDNYALSRKLSYNECAFGLTAWAPGGKEPVVFSSLEIRQLGEKD